MNAELTARSETSSANGSSRLMSLDALRGFDMFWILGGDSLAYAIGKISSSGWARTLSEQLDHVQWEGFHFYDLIFPLFVFLMGASAVFSLGKKQEVNLQAAYLRLLRRTVILYLIGLFYYGGRSHVEGGDEMFRYVGVLQRIAICYFFTGLVVLHFSWRGVAGVAAGLLVIYWALMNFVPVPGQTVVSLEEGKNLANYVDEHYLPGYKWDGEGRWDPEGLLSTIPAISSGLLGALAGMILRRSDWDGMRRTLLLLALGAGCLATGFLWGMQFPIIKKLWTSSYVLVAGGYSYLLLAVFYLVIDVWKLQTWARPFVWLGMNSITIYLLAELLDFTSIVRRVVQNDWLAKIEPYGPLVVACLSLTLVFAICYELYRRRIFLRV